MRAHTLAAHGEGLALHLIAQVGYAQFDQLVYRTQRILLHGKKVRDTGRVAQALDTLLLQRRIAPEIDLQAVPVAINPRLRVNGGKHLLQVALELGNKALTNLAALDGDFGEEFDDQFHGGWHIVRKALHYTRSRRTVLG